MHQWKNAKGEAFYLKHQHRHMFHIECKKRVFHNDRDVEFITFKKDVIEYLHFNYYDTENRIHNFNTKSCEMIATELLEYFDLEYCSVFEDNENGAEVYI